VQIFNQDKMDILKLEEQLQKHEESSKRGLTEWEPKSPRPAHLDDASLVHSYDSDSSIPQSSPKYFTGGMISVVQEYEDSKGAAENVYEYVLMSPRSPGRKTHTGNELCPQIMSL